MRKQAVVLPLLVASIAAACGSEPAAPEPSPEETERTLRLVTASGTGQSAFVGEALAAWVVVRVEDETGRPVGGVRVRFEVVSGGGAVEAGERTTTELGLAGTSWRLGVNPGPQLLSATIPGADAGTIEIPATAVDPRDADIVIIRGANHSGASVVLTPWYEVETPETYPPDWRVLALGDSVLRLLPRDAGAVVAQCHQIVAFVGGRPPALVTPRWTSGRDTIEVAVPEPFSIPLTIWVLRNPSDALDFAATAAGVQRDLDVLTSFWGVFGLRLGEVRVHDLSHNATPLGCGNVPDSEPGRINVYYGAFEPSIAQFGGFACGVERVLMRPQLTATTPGRILLAHELGHTFGLGHLASTANFMNQSASGGGATLGQVFHTHFAANSAINAVYGLRNDEVARGCYWPSASDW